jgi:hypothetical protein
MGELAPATADLPNSFVRLFPNCLKMLDEGARSSAQAEVFGGRPMRRAWYRESSTSPNTSS